MPTNRQGQPIVTVHTKSATIKKAFGDYIGDVEVRFAETSRCGSPKRRGAVRRNAPPPRTGAHAGYITGWIANHGHEVLYCPDMPYIQIKTPEGRVLVSPSDWIIRGVAGEFYPCRADIFAATYEGGDA